MWMKKHASRYLKSVGVSADHMKEGLGALEIPKHLELFIRNLKIWTVS